MIDNLRISYEHDRDVSVTISTRTGIDDNLPYNLAAIFARVMRDSDVNAEMVIGNLIAEYGLDYSVNKNDD